ncbi:MAG: hypothetical protein U9N59_15835 [Campylobacterota bacterium]|nr:hypothetical protein [Campylobacterota bacterium]
MIINEKIKNIYPFVFLKDLPGLSVDLRFGKIKEKTKKSIDIMYYGKSLNGSYINESEMVSSYLAILNSNAHGLKFSYKGGDNVYTYGRYVFTIKLTSLSIDEPKGKRFSASQYSAFAINIGEPWALMFRIASNIINNNQDYTSVGIIYENKNIIIDGKEIFKVIDINKETRHHFKRNTNGGLASDCNRSYFNASFELFVDENKLLSIFMIKFKQILIHNCKVQDFDYTCKEINYTSCSFTSDRLDIIYSDSDFNSSIRVGDGFPFIVKKKIAINKDEKFPKFILGKDVNFKNQDYNTVKLTSYCITKQEGVTYDGKGGKWDITGDIEQLDLLKENKPDIKEHKLLESFDFNTFPFRMYKSNFAKHREDINKENGWATDNQLSIYPVHIEYEVVNLRKAIVKEMQSEISFGGYMLKEYVENYEIALQEIREDKKTHTYIAKNKSYIRGQMKKLKEELEIFKKIEKPDELKNRFNKMDLDIRSNLASAKHKYDRLIKYVSGYRKIKQQIKNDLIVVKKLMNIHYQPNNSNDNGKGL